MYSTLERSGGSRVRIRKGEHVVDTRHDCRNIVRQLRESSTLKHTQTYDVKRPVWDCVSECMRRALQVQFNVTVRTPPGEKLLAIANLRISVHGPDGLMKVTLLG